MKIIIVKKDSDKIKCRMIDTSGREVSRIFCRLDKPFLYWLIKNDINPFMTSNNCILTYGNCNVNNVDVSLLRYNNCNEIKEIYRNYKE